MPAAALTFIVALGGAAVGSFLNVLVIRTHEGRSAVRGRSACPACGRPIPWYDLLPIVSFIVLGGRCRFCHARLSGQYLLGELLTAAVFTAVFMRFPWPWLMLVGWIAAAALVAIALYDGQWSLIPDEYTLALALSAAAFVLLAHQSLIASLIGLAAGAAFFGAQFLFSRGRWVGSGDIMLGAALGLLLGWPRLLVALFVAYMIGGIIASVLLLTHRRRSGQTLPFGPYLALGAFVGWLWGPELITWYLTHAL